MPGAPHAQDVAALQPERTRLIAPATAHLTTPHQPHSCLLVAGRGPLQQQVSQHHAGGQVVHPHRRMRSARQRRRLHLQRAQQLRDGGLGGAVGCVLWGGGRGRRRMEETSTKESVGPGAHQSSSSRWAWWAGGRRWRRGCVTTSQPACTGCNILRSSPAVHTCGVGAPSEPAPSKLKMWPPPGWPAMCRMAAWVASRLPSRLVRTTWRGVGGKGRAGRAVGEAKIHEGRACPDVLGRALQISGGQLQGGQAGRHTADPSMRLTCAMLSAGWFTRLCRVMGRRWDEIRAQGTAQASVRPAHLGT